VEVDAIEVDVGKIEHEISSPQPVLKRFGLPGKATRTMGWRCKRALFGLLLFFYGFIVSSAALVGAIVKVYTPEVGVTVVVERVP
jgi:hypothetical protein